MLNGPSKRLSLPLRRLDGPFNTRSSVFPNRVVWYRLYLYSIEQAKKVWLLQGPTASLLIMRSRLDLYLVLINMLAWSIYKRVVIKGQLVEYLFWIRNLICPTGSTPKISPTTQATRHPQASSLFMFPLPQYFCHASCIRSVPCPPVLYI